MIRHPELLAIVAVAFTGVIVLWANPRRLINRLFLTTALHVAAWMLCVHIAVVNGVDPLWVRGACIVGVFIPVHMWFLKEASIGQTTFWGRRPRRRNGWLGVAAVLALLALTRSFARPQPGEAGLEFGVPYFLFLAGFAAMLGVLWRETLRDLRSQAGVARLELQILLFGGGAAALAVVFLMALHALAHARWPIQFQPFVIFAFYSATVMAITTHRIFNARQVVLVIGQKTILVVVATAAAFGIDRALATAGLPKAFALPVTVAVTLWLVAGVSRRLDRMFQFYPEGDAVRKATYAAARETRADDLAAAFCAVLRGWGRSEHAIVLSGNRASVAGGGITIGNGSRIVDTMRELRWVTPERLARERASPARDEVRRFLDDNDLGVLALAEGPALTVFAGVGASRQPFTYPQAMQLIELASIIEGAFERARLSTKAQHAGQLATVGLLGASLAHEIRNPLVTIKTFVQLLPAHYQDAVFRDKFFRLIGDEVGRIDRLTEQLLDLASPRTYSATMVELHPILRASIELVATKAARRSVQLVADFTAAPDTVHTDAAAARQVMLNLCFNAIQALEQKDEGPRCIWIATRNAPGGVEVAVTDNGPGIPPEMMPRLFQPFQTTKSSGFGLGLAICSDILGNLGAAIAADPPVPGRGATFRVTFPFQPSKNGSQ